MTGDAGEQLNQRVAGAATAGPRVQHSDVVRHGPSVDTRGTEPLPRRLQLANVNTVVHRRPQWLRRQHRVRLVPMPEGPTCRGQRSDSRQARMPCSRQPDAVAVAASRCLRMEIDVDRPVRLCSSSRPHVGTREGPSLALARNRWAWCPKITPKGETQRLIDRRDNSQRPQLAGPSRESAARRTQVGGRSWRDPGVSNQRARAGCRSERCGRVSRRPGRTLRTSWSGIRCRRLGRASSLGRR